MRLTGVQVSRGVESAGGLFSPKNIDLFCGMHRAWWSKLDDERKPRPVTWVFYAVGHEPRTPLYAGEDVIDYLEATERFHAAEKMVEAVNSVRIKMRRELRAPKRK